MSGESAGGTAEVPDTSEEILGATYRALCAHGYADLTMQDIADESATSKSAIHYHYDTKEGLLLAFLDHLYESFTDEHAAVEGDHAVERLIAFVDGILCRSGDDGDEDLAFQTALLELKAQAPYVEAYRDEMARIDGFVRGRVREIVAEGIDEGVIRDEVDPEDAAAFVSTMIEGVNARRVAIGGTDGGTRRTFVAYVRDHLVAPDADVEVAA